jgi:hypothetical protein
MSKKLLETKPVTRHEKWDDAVRRSIAALVAVTEILSAATKAVKKAIRGRPSPPRSAGSGRLDSERLERPLEPAVATHAASAAASRRFVAAVLVASLGALAGVFTLNVLVDPFAIAGTGLLPTAVENDRSVKLNLMQKLTRDPEIIILGSSRARQAESAFLEKLTGHTAFNAAVTGGTAADAWVMSRYAADRFPHQKRRFVWFVDKRIATNGINPQLEDDPRARRYLAGKSLHFTLEDVGTYVSLEATRASFRVLRACVLGTCRGRLRYLPDGSLARPTLKYLPEHARSLSKSIAKLIASMRTHPPITGRVDPRRYVYFERTIALVNAEGSRPVIVLNPIHPAVLAELRRRGFPARKRSLAYLRTLHQRLDFVVVDCQDIRRWGGSPKDFTNATHVNRRNMRRMLRYIVAHSDGALT